ncbi:unnamed protein product, partial [Mesorhabditis belari]|uniref:Uncharacterized protein n=1 Tax=Mesorhabditis belari TaxID=2138241 RepID=A0AAF3FLJ4_9BILA
MAAAVASSTDRKTTVIKYTSLVILVLQNCSLVLFMRYALTGNRPKFLKTISVFWGEIFKLCASILLVCFEARSLQKGFHDIWYEFTVKWRDLLKVLVPAAVYTVQNFLLYVAVDNLPAATYMVTYQLKILTTAIFTVAVLKRKLSWQQWLALVVLFGGVVIVQYDQKLSDDAEKANRAAFIANQTTTMAPIDLNLTGVEERVKEKLDILGTTLAPFVRVERQATPSPPPAHIHEQNSILGFTAVLVACFLSGFAGIYFEKILKGSNVSIWIRNIQLAFPSLFFALLFASVKDREVLFADGFSPAAIGTRMMSGFDWAVWVTVGISAFGGLVVAVVIKYADNILKAFATSFAIVLNCVLAYWLFNFHPTYLFVLGAIMVIGAVFGYSIFPYRATHQPIPTVETKDDNDEELKDVQTKLSGEIRLAKALDRETLDRHVLKVTAFERLDPSISSSASVVVEVSDVQDNSPQFERDSYVAEISEDAPIGTTVVSVFARDRDAGANGEVVYSLEEAEGSDLLQINPKSGVIQTAAALDRETLPLIKVNVIASDQGKPQLSSKALIEVTINDVNDNAPVFEQSNYDITVLENTTIPVVVARLKATDLDNGANGRVHYGMVTSSDILHVDYKTGEVTLRRKIDARSGIRTFVVRAKDGAQPALSTTATLSLQILDINDHAPRFIAAQKSVLVDEGIKKGEEVARVYAIDEDTGVNGKIRYSLEGSSDFEIDPETGVIIANKTLDREETQRYELTVKATDGGEPQLSAGTQMTILVRDINDNAPIFRPAEMNVTLSEETQIGAQIAIVRAEDRDEEPKLFYRIEHQDRDGLVALIDLGDQGALLSLSETLRPTDHSLKVVVSASDDGGLKGTCTINIHVTDVNSPPRFPPQPFAVHIPEDSLIGNQVIVVRAEDTDRGDNAEITYSIDSDLFEINNVTGEITVAGLLDREEQSSHSLTVTATDSADPPLSSSTIIEVTLDDVNDNAPEFSSQNYMATVSEDIAVGTSFIQIMATDTDGGTNGIVDYFLNASGIGAELFRLDRTSGTLRVNQKLDREKLPIITLPVYAKDRGSPPLSANSIITVMLQDVNDNPPKFSQSSYDLWIAENAPAGTLVGTLVATDPDEGSNAEIEFRVFGGTDARLFELESDPIQKGVVKLLSKQPFDYESKTNAFSLEVQASSGQLSSTVPVRVHVSDVNDHPPTLRSSVLLINRFLDGPIIEKFGSIPAFDPDQNATLEYSIESNDLMIKDRYSGKIHQRLVEKGNNIDTILKACVSDNQSLLSRWAEKPQKFGQALPIKPHKCDIRVDECFSGPCQHNGSCFPLENGYRCECENGWNDVVSDRYTLEMNHCHGSMKTQAESIRTLKIRLGGQTKLAELSDEKENRINETDIGKHSDHHLFREGQALIELSILIWNITRTLTLWLDDYDPLVLV